MLSADCFSIQIVHRQFKLVKTKYWVPLTIQVAILLFSSAVEIDDDVDDFSSSDDGGVERRVGLQNLVDVVGSRHLDAVDVGDDVT